MVRRIRRGTVVFVEAVLAVAVAGIAFGVVRHHVAGFVIGGVALLVGVAGLVRPGGRGLVDVVAGRLRDPAPDAPDADPGRDLGTATRLAPRLHVADVPTRDGGGIGVVGDGQGFAVVLDAGLTAPPTWALQSLVELLVDDPARPAAVQVLVEQHGLGASPDPRFGPSRTYRKLPVGGLPLWNRVLVAVRHEPAWAPESVENRGGGVTGAHNALAAVAGRLAARAARDRIRLRPLGAAELAGLLRDLGPPPVPDAGDDPAAVNGNGAGDVVVGVPPTRENAVADLLPALAALGLARSVVAVTVSAVDHGLYTVARLTDPRGAVVEQAVAQLVADGLAVALPRFQDAGMLAALPLGGGARSLEGVVGQVRR